MTQVIDQTNDPGFSTLRVIVDRFPRLREMAKTANLDPSEFSNLPDEAFAWPGQRRFPIHNAEHTALSMGYSKVAQKLPSDVAETMEKAASLHGVDTEAFEEPVAIEKVASDDGHYLIPDKRRFKIASKEDVPVAERIIHEKYSSLSVGDRTIACMQLVKVAEEYGEELHPSTIKLAGLTITSTRTMRDWIEARKEASLRLGSAMAQAFETLANQFQDVEPFIHNRGDQMKLASALQRMDEAAGLTQFYGRKLLDPIETVFNTPHRSDNFVKVGSALQNKALLASLPLSFWEDALGPEIAAEIAPNGQVDITMLEQILPTLPADLKSALETQLAAYNR